VSWYNNNAAGESPNYNTNVAKEIFKYNWYVAIIEV